MNKNFNFNVSVTGLTDYIKTAPQPLLEILNSSEAMNMFNVIDGVKKTVKIPTVLRKTGAVGAVRQGYSAGQNALKDRYEIDEITGETFPYSYKESFTDSLWQTKLFSGGNENYDPQRIPMKDQVFRLIGNEIIEDLDTRIFKGDKSQTKQDFDGILKILADNATVQKTGSAPAELTDSTAIPTVTKVISLARKAARKKYKISTKTTPMNVYMCEENFRILYNAYFKLDKGIDKNTEGNKFVTMFKMASEQANIYMVEAMDVDNTIFATIANNIHIFIDSKKDKEAGKQIAFINDDLDEMVQARSNWRLGLTIYDPSIIAVTKA